MREPAEDARGCCGELDALHVERTIIVGDVDDVGVDRRRVDLAAQELDLSGIVAGSNQDRLQRGSGHEAVHLVPLPVEPVPVPLRVETQAVVHSDPVVDVGQAMRGLESGELRGTVAAQGIAVEVAVGQAKVGLVRILVGVAEFRGDLLVALTAGLPAPFDVERVADEAGVSAAVEILEAGAAVAHRLDQVGGPFERPREGGLDLVEAVVAGAQVDLGEPRLRHRTRDEVDRAADGVRTVANGGWAFQDLDSVDAADVRHVVGGRRGVGGRRDQHAVLHDGDLLAAFGRGPADADVGAQPEAVLFAHVHARHGGQDLVEVDVVELLECLLIDERSGAGDSIGVLP